MTVDQREEVDAVRTLGAAVRAADAVLSDGHDLTGVKEVLVTVFADVAPVYGLLDAMAVAWPAGPVAAVLGHLRDALGHVVDDRAELATVDMHNAAVAAFRLVGAA
jgi:hypothetical protein